MSICIEASVHKCSFFQLNQKQFTKACKGQKLRIPFTTRMDKQNSKAQPGNTNLFASGLPSTIAGSQGTLVLTASREMVRKLVTFSRLRPGFSESAIVCVFLVYLSRRLIAFNIWLAVLLLFVFLGQHRQILEKKKAKNPCQRWLNGSFRTA